MAAAPTTIQIKSVSGLPADELRYIVGLMTGAETFSKVRAIRAALKLANYLTDTFFGSSDMQALAIPMKETKVSKKQIAKALEALADKGDVQVKAIPAWLVPVLLGLARKWLENRK